MITLYLTLAGLTFCGIIIGIILGMIAPEELSLGVPWFIKMQDTLFIILILALLYYNLTNLTIIPLMIFLLFYWYKEGIGKNAYILEFGMLGAIFGIGYNSGLFLLISTLIFIYCVANGSLLKFKISRKILLFKALVLRLIFFIIGTLLPLLIAYM